MTKSKVNLVIDALLLLSIATIVGIGLLIKYVLVPGYQRFGIYGRNVNLFLWGLDRHEWGKIHFIIGLVFLALLVLHIGLHWAMIVEIYRALIPNLFARWIIGLILLCLTFLLFIFPYFLRPEVWEQGSGVRDSCWRQCEGSCDIPTCPQHKR